MSEQIKDGGPAFPQPDLSGYGIGPVLGMSGMSLRDYFAGQALVSMGTWVPQNAGGSIVADVVTSKADWAYLMADAMLKARG